MISLFHCREIMPYGKLIEKMGFTERLRLFLNLMPVKPELGSQRGFVLTRDNVY